MNMICKSTSYLIVALLSTMAFLLGPSVLGNTLLGMPSSHGCHQEEDISAIKDHHGGHLAENKEQASCCDTGLCPSGICCAYVIAGALDIRYIQKNERIYTQKEKIFGFSVIFQSILEPPG